MSAVRKLQTGKPIEMREADFKTNVNLHKVYPQDLRDAFISYWTEPNKSGTKMRFELEKTWSTARRLGTWDRNNFGNKGSKTPVITMHPVKKPDIAPESDVAKLDLLLIKYSNSPTLYTIDIITRTWPAESINNCYQIIREYKLWDPTITKQDLEKVTDEKRLKATVIVRTLDYYGVKGWGFQNTLDARQKLL